MRSAVRCVGFSTTALGVAATATLFRPSTNAPCESLSSSLSAPPRQSASAPFLWSAAGAVCGTRRSYASLTRPLRQPSGRTRGRLWMCSKKECRTVNKAVAPQCEACGTTKPVLLRWKCVDCGTVNFAGVKQCKQCREPASKSAEYWMCADCGENNRIDDLDDNRVCGFCGYDMAPRSAMEEKIFREVEEAAATRQRGQEHFDNIPFQDADEQLNDPLEGREHLDPAVRESWSQKTANATGGSSRHLHIPRVTAFVPSTKPPPTRHSRLHRSINQRRALVEAANAIPSGPPGFDWMCRTATCGHINPGDEEACMECHAHIRPCDWECPMCAATNHLSRSRCFNCRTPIPVCWSCAACQTKTSIYDRTCRSCGTERPPAEPRLREDVDPSLAPRNHAITMQRDEKRGEWHCSSCNELNFSRRTECFRCNAPRPTTGDGDADPFAANGWGSDAAPLGQRPSAPAALQNNWICTHCQASNFRTRHDCWKCGRASEHQNAWSSETAAPQFEREGFQTGADDKPAMGKMNTTWQRDADNWTCAKCYASNFRSRSDCYRCGARKVAIASTRSTRARRPVKL